MKPIKGQKGHSHSYYRLLKVKRNRGMIGRKYPFCPLLPPASRLLVATAPPRPNHASTAPGAWSSLGGAR